jgi:hypothetical protein
LVWPQEAIEEVQEEITQSFEYLENEDYGGSQPSSNKGSADLRRIPSPEAPPFPEAPRRPKQELNAMAVGKTSFAERVRIFQSLGRPTFMLFCGSKFCWSLIRIQ